MIHPGSYRKRRGGFIEAANVYFRAWIAWVSFNLGANKSCLAARFHRGCSITLKSSEKCCISEPGGVFVRGG